MIKGVEIKKLEKLSDARGFLAEFFRNDETKYKPAMGYVSETKPGVARGPHEHKRQSDFFVFLLGEFRIYLWDNRRSSKKNFRRLEVIEVSEIKPCTVLVPPGVVHAYKCISKKPGIIINFPNKLYKGKNKKQKVDEVRWEGRSDSPFIVD